MVKSGIYLVNYPPTPEASKYLNVTKANNITGVLNGDRAKAYGLKWEL